LDDEGVGGGVGKESRDEVEEVDDFLEEDLRMGLGALHWEGIGGKKNG